MFYRLTNTIRTYAWGSRDALTELYGFELPGREPMAELWMGAHPRAVSRLTVDGVEIGLDEYIAANPERALGVESTRDTAADRLDAGLPFLFKILCAAAPLSIQVHPSLEQARAGFAAEEAAGLDRDAPNRNYRDDNHKPELICAIRPFWGLRGFRSVEEIRDELTTVELSEADARPELPESEDELGEFFRELLLLSDGPRRELIAAAVALSIGRWPGGKADTVPEIGNPLARYYWVLRIAEEHPGDIGVLSPLLFNVFSLQPGEATYQPAGVLHAYLHGVGAELMANSDNVLRGGMTVKHVDVDELMKVGRFRSEAPVVLVGDPVEGSSCREIEYPTPFSEFAFSRLVAGPECRVPVGTAQILFCHEGPLRLRCDGVELELSAGESVFVDATSNSLEVLGAGEVFRARIPEQP
ncbi:MAG: mannose-6-phosphate isomerase, class I [Spirochaetota bacterium]